MVWCSHCADDCDTQQDLDKGYICCAVCGKVIDHDVYFSGPSFEKSSSGQSRLSGNILNSSASAYSLSRQKTLDKGRYEIGAIVLHLNVGGGESIISRAHNLYIIAVERNFTKGRRTSHVAAACLYIACRQSEKAYLLIDFSDYLKISVYVLGAVFLQLCKLLRLSDHPIIQKLVDPSLFIHRFTERLLGRRNNPVSEVALRIVASMKRDWMQTGRKPSGLCGAALYISALSHGLNYSKSDIVTVVHICETTLTKRLIEFENTESGSLTIDEFIARADELNDVSRSYQSPIPGEVLCEHKDTDEPHFAHGLCRQCFNEFVKLSGGLKGGAEPPSFQHAERQRMKKIKADGKLFESNDIMKQDMEEDDVSLKLTLDPTGHASPVSKEPNIDGYAPISNSACNDSEQDLHEEETRDPENFSDIDDIEVDGYLHNEEEQQFKKIIWEEMNKEYLEEQATKEAAAAAAKVASDAALANNCEDFRSAQELAAATAEALAISKKEKRQKRAEEKRNAAPAKSPLEATCQVLKRKSFSSKINYKALESLYTDNAKKQCIEVGVGEAGNGEKIFQERQESDEDPEMYGEDDVERRASVEDYHKNNYDFEDGDYGNVDYFGNEDDYYAGDDYGNANDYY